MKHTLSQEKLNIRIDPEFESLIPPLSDEEFNQLRDNILEEDECHDPIIIWEEPGAAYFLIVDGHNRWKIIQENPHVSYDINTHIFSDREEVKEWMIRNQLGRRNVPDYVRTELALKLKSAIAARAKKNLSTHKGSGYQGLENPTKAVNTREEIASIAGVSSNTVAKVERIVKEAPDDVKNKLRNGEMSINRAYSQIKNKQPDDQDEEITSKEGFAYSAPSKYRKQFDDIAKGHMENLQVASQLLMVLGENDDIDQAHSSGKFTITDIASDIAKAMWYFHDAYGIPFPDTITISRGLGDIWRADKNDS